MPVAAPVSIPVLGSDGPAELVGVLVVAADGVVVVAPDVDGVVAGVVVVWVGVLDAALPRTTTVPCMNGWTVQK